MLAGMGGIAHSDLVAAVSGAGGFGTLGSAVMVRSGPDELRNELAEVREKCKGKPFGVDILVPGSGEGGVMNQIADIIIESGAKAFISGLGFPRPEIIEKFHKGGVLVGTVSGRVKHAQRAVKAGVDFVVAQGTEAGGHTGEIALSVLLPQIIDAVGHKVPVVAAGGIFDGRGLASALAYGADGVWIGTRFLLTPEAHTVPFYKERLLAASSEDTVVTKSYTGRRLRVLKNKYTEHYEKHPELIQDPGRQVINAINAGAMHLGGGPDTKNVDPDKEAFLVGQCVGAIKELKPAAQVVHDMMAQCIEILQKPKQFQIVQSKL
jgi:enoyl-[acyl-carrier protein] reductase II